MPLYGSDLFSPLKKAFDIPAQNMEEKARELFGGSAARQIRERKNKLDSSTFYEALNTFGIEAITDWNNKSKDILDSLSNDLKNAQQKAIEARKSGDLESYGEALQRQLRDKELATLAQSMEKQRWGQIITALIGAVSSIGGNIMGKRKNAEEEQAFWDEFYRNLDTVMYSPNPYEYGKEMRFNFVKPIPQMTYYRGF